MLVSCLSGSTETCQKDHVNKCSHIKTCMYVITGMYGNVVYDLVCSRL